MPLSKYIADTAALVNDPNFCFTSKNQMVSWVNEGRRNLAKRTGCIRRLITGQSAFGASAQPGIAIPGAIQPGALPNSTPAGTIFGAATSLVCQTIPNVERYPYVGFFNPVLQSQYAGCDQVIDIISLSVNWGGVNRPTLDWMPWDNLQAYARAYAVLNSAYPSVWSVYNDGTQGEVWMFPVPSQAGDIEADAAVTPKSLYSDDDFDAIPDGFKEGVKFATAELIFMSSARYAQAEAMASKYQENVGIAHVAADRGKTASYYWTVP
jgi:hypothetical protein